MFVRKKPNKSGSYSVQIIDKSQGQYRLFKTIGSSKDPNEIEDLIKRGNELIRSHMGQLSLFNEALTNWVEEVGNDDLKHIGSTLIFTPLFERLGFSVIEDDFFRPLVISRILFPSSKLKFLEYLEEYEGVVTSVYSVYRFMDRFNSKYKSVVEELCYRYTKSILGGQVGVVFYDMTTIYFEADKEDDLRKAGFSKDGKHRHPQIFIGLLVGSGGYPIGYEIFEGNTFEGHTLIPVLKGFEAKYNLSKPIIVADSGLLNKDNIEHLERESYQYIIGARLKNESEKVKQQILDHSLTDGQHREIRKDRNTRVIISYSDKRASKDLFNRERGLKRLERQLQKGRLNKSHINNRGYNKYLNLEGEISISIDYDKFKADSQWDGLKGYITNTILEADQVIEQYHNLWHIEKAFRITKHDLKVRPVFHRLKKRIEAHICICFVAYTIYKEIERLLKVNHSTITITQAIVLTQKMYGFNVPTLDGRIILKKFKLNKKQNELLKIIQN